MNKKNTIFLIGAAVSAGGFLGMIRDGSCSAAAFAPEAKMVIKSEAFGPNGPIPKKFTCQGANVNPALQIEHIPPQAKSLVLIVDDPDAPMGTWTHWVVYDMPVIFEISESSVPGKQGITSMGKIGYHGPCPPSGTHRYFFKLFALDALLDLPEDLTRDEVEKAMQGRILAQAELIGLYKKS